MSNMTDWKKVYGFNKYTYVEKFPITSFLLSGVSYYKNIVKDIQIGDTLIMEIEQNIYDTDAIVIKKEENTCGYVPKNAKERVKKYVPSAVKVIDKHFIENGIYSLRVDIVTQDT